MAQEPTSAATAEHTAHVAHRIRNKPLQSGLRADLGMITLALGGGLFGNVMSSADVAACAREQLEGHRLVAHSP